MRTVLLVLAVWVIVSIPASLMFGRLLRPASGYLCSMCAIGIHCKGGSRQVCFCPCGDEED